VILHFLLSTILQGLPLTKETGTKFNFATVKDYNLFFTTTGPR
jgi:hypothetical protein